MERTTKALAEIAKHPATKTILKVADIALLAGASLTPGGAAVYEVSKIGLEKASKYVQQRNELRILDFHRNFLYRDGMPEEQLLTAELEEANFHALLNACVTDIEDEKTVPYANLTRAIALGKVSQPLRRHYIVSLRDIAWDHLDFLRRAYVVTKHPIIPPKGNLNLDPATLLTDYQPGSPKHLAVVSLNAKGFIDGVKLSDIGIKFVESCSNDEDLSPYAFGYQTWLPHDCTIISVIGNQGIMFATQVQDELIKQRIKAKVIMTLTNEREPHIQTAIDWVCIITANGTPHSPELSEQLSGIINGKNSIQLVFEDGTSEDYVALVDSTAIPIRKKTQQIDITKAVSLLLQAVK